VNLTRGSSAAPHVAFPAELPASLRTIGNAIKIRLKAGLGVSRSGFYSSLEVSLFFYSLADLSAFSGLLFSFLKYFSKAALTILLGDAFTLS
jgi:hypothetical protein